MESEKGSCLVLMVQCCLFFKLLFLRFLSLDANSRSNICSQVLANSWYLRRQKESFILRCTGANLFLSHHLMFFYKFGFLGVFLQGQLDSLNWTWLVLVRFQVNCLAKIDLIKRPSVGRWNSDIVFVCFLILMYTWGFLAHHCIPNSWDFFGFQSWKFVSKDDVCVCSSKGEASVYQSQHTFMISIHLNHHINEWTVLNFSFQSCSYGNIPGPVENHNISLLYIHNIVKMFCPFKAKTFYKILINYFGYVLNFVLKWEKNWGFFTRQLSEHWLM